MTRRAGTLALAAAILAGAAVLSFRPIYEPDIWWHLAQGREAAASGPVRANVFSFTHPDYRQQYTPWLFDLAAYGAWRAGGAAGVQAIQFACLALTFWLLYAASRARAPAWAAAAALGLAFVIFEPRAIPRPHLVSLAGMAAMALLVERSAARQSAQPLVWALPLTAIWSNLHVEVVFGVALAGVYAAAELARPASLPRAEAVRALALAAGCAAATVLNPYGWGLVLYLFENTRVPLMMAIAELRPPYLPEYRGFYAYLVLGAALLLAQPRRLQLREVAAAVLFATLGLLHLRLTPLVVLATAPMLAVRLAAVTRLGIDPRAVLATAVAAALVLSRIPPPLLLTTWGFGRAGLEPQAFFSRDAMAFVRRAGLEGPAFNSHNLGGYLAWMAYPRVRVFQDSRLQAYPPDHFRSILEAAATQPEWDRLVEPVDWAILSVPRPNQLSGAGRFPREMWATVYRDEAVEIVARRAGRYAHLATGEPRR